MILSREWIKNAACHDARSELFFTDTKHTRIVEYVKQRYCRHCPVLLECRQYALDTDSDGIFGGMTKEERNRSRSWGAIFELWDGYGSGRSFASLLSTPSSTEASLSNESLGNKPREPERPDDERSSLPYDIPFPGTRNPSASQMPIVVTLELPSSLLRTPVLQ